MKYGNHGVPSITSAANGGDKDLHRARGTSGGPQRPGELHRHVEEDIRKSQGERTRAAKSNGVLDRRAEVSYVLALLSVFRFLTVSV